MKRFAATALLLVVVSGLCAEDLPKPINEDDRVALLKKWRGAYDIKVQKTKSDLEDARLAKNNNKIATLTADLSNLKKHPFLTDLGDFKTIRDGQPFQVGKLVQPSLTVSKVLANGIVVEGTYAINRAVGGGGFNVQTTKETVVVRYFIASRLANSRPKAKVKLDGLWYVAGKVEMMNRELPVLYRFEVKPDELPSTRK